MTDYLNPHKIYPDMQNQPDLNLQAHYYDTKPAVDCPVCGGMFKDIPCEVCGYAGEVIKEITGKDAIIRHCNRRPSVAEEGAGDNGII